MAHDVAASILELAKAAHATELEARRAAAEAARAASLQSTRTRLTVFAHKRSEYNGVPHYYCSSETLQYAHDGAGRVHFRRKGEKDDLSVPLDAFDAVLDAFVDRATFAPYAGGKVTCVSCSVYLDRFRPTKRGGAAWRRLLDKRLDCQAGGQATFDAPTVKAACGQLIEAARDIRIVVPAA